MSVQKFIREIQVSNFEAIKTQIQKDFNMAGIEFSCNETTINSFVECLNKHVSNLNQNAVNELKNLLYRIDASEKYIQKLSLAHKLALEDIITLAILKRTAEKVAFREKFKK